MKLLQFLGLATFALGIAAQASAQTAAISLSIPPTARANGMGEAGVAVADDATATWWNPAGLAFQTENDASFTHAQLVPGLANDVFYEFPSYTTPISNWGTFGVSLVYLSYGKSQGADAVGTPLGEFSSSEYAPAISYGTKVTDRLGLGASFKYIRVSLSPDFQGIGAGRGSTVAADFGLLYKVPGDLVNLAATVQNLGPHISFITDQRSDPIFTNLRAGVAVHAYKTKETKLLLVGDVNQLLVRGELDTGQRKYPKPIWNGGGELGYNNLIALRAGYVYDSEGSIKDPTYGFGLDYHGIRFDYGSIPQAKDPDTGTRLDRVNKFSLAYSF